MHYFEQSKINNLSLHFVGNKSEGEKIILSNKEVVIGRNIKDLLTTYFLSPFKSQEYYQFYHDSALSLNEVYTYVSAIFHKPKELHRQSINIAKHLYHQSTHPKIKGGEFYVVYFENCIVDGETTNAIGLFKSENKETFLKISSTDGDFEIEDEQGVNINKLDKGCLIFNIEAKNGYIVSVVDNINRGTEAQYWIDDFLHIRQRHDKYFNTANTLSAYKNYIVNQLPEEYEISKADQADFLNRSIQFFKEKDSFELQEFNKEVLQHPEYIKSFNRYKTQYQEESGIELSDHFSISNAAVKRQSRNFKSIIKLDKNFHIYIHGNRELIEQGEDKKGKFYKIYFQTES